jgi:hypothetical protein
LRTFWSLRNLSARAVRSLKALKVKGGMSSSLLSGANQNWRSEYTALVKEIKI